MYGGLRGCSHVATLSDLSAELLAHAGQAGDEAFLLAGLENFLDFVGDVLQVLLLGEVHVGLDLTVLVEELEGGVVDVEEGVLDSLGDGGVDHVTGVVGALVHLGGEDVLALQDDLGGSVLSGLGGGHIGDLAGVALDHDEGADLQSVGVDLFGLGGTGVGVFELLVLARHINYFLKYKDNEAHAF